MTTNQFHSLGYTRGPERPERWSYRLIPQTSPDKSKLRSLDKYRMQPPFDQDVPNPEGSCTANSGCLVAQMCAAIDGNPVPVLSRQWLYWIERELINTLPADSGADVIDEVQAPQKYGGHVADAIWPYDGLPAEQPPTAVQSATKYEPVASYQPIAASDFLDGILSALDANLPVAIGFNFYNGWFNDYSNGLLTKGAMDSVAGGHAVTIVGYAPPSAALPAGGWLCQNSWGATSKARTDLHPNAKPGDFIFPCDLFALPSVQADASAAVAANQPAILTLTLTGPASVQAGAAAGFSATLTGLPAGSVVGYTWDFGDGTSPVTAAATASHAYTAAGNYPVTCTATVQTTGASAKGAMAVSVTAAPTPQPASCRTEVDAAYAAQLAAITAAQKGGDVLITAGWYALLNTAVTWSQQETDADLGNGATGVRVPKLPQPPQQPGTVTAATIIRDGDTIVLGSGPIGATLTYSSGQKVRVG